LSYVQIPNLPAVASLAGAELFEGVQSGTSVKISLNQIAEAVRFNTSYTIPILVSQGGTGVTTLTGYVKGSGTTPFTASSTIPNTDITGLGTMSTQNANAVAITGGSVTGITDITVSDGGTGVSTLTGYVKGAGTSPLTASATIPSTDITGLGTMSTQNANAVAITGGTITGITALAAASGGTGISSYTIGDILYASGITTLSKLADVATGSAIISGGVGVAPSYGKIGLTTHVSGTLGVDNGGTGQASNLTQYGVIYGSTTTAMATTAAGTATQVLHGNASGAPTFGAVSLTADVSGTLPLANGGLGVTTAPAAAAVLLGYTSTATAAGTTVLTNTSSQYQLFTGVTTQTITLPVTSTLGTGWSFHIVNNSTGSLTVNSSGGNLVATIIAGLSAMVTCIGTTLTTAADWEAGFTDFQSLTGTGAAVLGTGPTITGAVSANATSGNGAITGQQIFQLAANVTAFGPAIGDFFGATSAISLEASSVYEIVIYAVMTKTTAGTATWTLTASSAPTRIIGNYQASPITGIAAGAPTSGFTGSQGATTAAFAATGSLTTAVNHAFQFVVQVQTNAASSFKLQLTQSAGTATPLAGSYYTVKKIGTTTGTFV
jgi:hypothetical protein